jgi:hypothetical protein
LCDVSALGAGLNRGIVSRGTVAEALGSLVRNEEVDRPDSIAALVLLLTMRREWTSSDSNIDVSGGSELLVKTM